MNTIVGPQMQPPLPTLAPIVGPANAGAAQEASTSFKEVLLGSIEEVNSLQQQADQAVEKMATGGDANPAEVLSAVQKADLAFRMMMQIRNKLVAAYDEVKNIRI